MFMLHQQSVTVFGLGAMTIEAAMINPMMNDGFVQITVFWESRF